MSTSSISPVAVSVTPSNRDRTGGADGRLPAGRSEGSATGSPLADQRSGAMKPKEHGAYAILAIPMLTALLGVMPRGGFTWSGLAISIAAFAGFLAHEPLMVLWGRRGKRAMASSPRAWRRFGGLIATTLTAGSFAFMAGSWTLRASLMACLLLAATQFLLSVGGWHRTFAAQLWGVVGLSVVCVPLYLSAGWSVSSALIVWTAWLFGFCATTTAVRGVIANQKRKPRILHGCIEVAIAAAIIALAVSTSQVYTAIVPMVLASGYLMAVPPPARQLKRVGWSLVVATLVSAIAMIGLTGSSI